MVISTDYFVPHILPHVIGCPDFSVRQAVINAAISFCEESHAWVEVLDLVQTANGIHSYTLDLPSKSRVILVTNVWAAGSELAAATMSEIAATYPNWQETKGVPRFYNQQNWEEFRIFPTPNAQSEIALTVRAALAPTRTATTIPDFLAERHFQGIVSGALKQLLMMPGQAWSNAQLAVYHDNELRMAISNAKAAIFHDRVQGSARVRPRRFGA